MSVVVAKNIRKSFGGLQVLKGVSLTVEGGEVVALIGGSGSGKSTFLRCLNGLESVDSGEIEVAGHRMSRKPAELRRLRAMSALSSRVTISSRISPPAKTSCSPRSR